MITYLTYSIMVLFNLIFSIIDVAGVGDRDNPPPKGKGYGFIFTSLIALLNGYLAYNSRNFSIITKRSVKLQARLDQERLRMLEEAKDTESSEVSSQRFDHMRINLSTGNGTQIS